MTENTFRNVMHRLTVVATALVLVLSGGSGCTMGGEDALSQGEDRVDHVSAQSCADPVESVLRIVACIEDENAFCASSGYASSFAKFHNTVDTETDVPGFFFWVGAFFALDFHLDINHAAAIGDNQVSLRYIETVTFNDGDTFVQHEHAIVTVDDRCKILLWDQYGDNEEQKAVEDKADEVNPF